MYILHVVMVLLLVFVSFDRWNQETARACLLPLIRSSLEISVESAIVKCSSTSSIQAHVTLSPNAQRFATKKGI